MKKFGKFLFGTISIAAIAGGAYYFLKNVINKETSDDFDDFSDDFDDDFDLDDDVDTESDSPAASENREYVTINISPEAKETTPTAESTAADSKSEENEDIPSDTSTDESEEEE